MCYFPRVEPSRSLPYRDGGISCPGCGAFANGTPIEKIPVAGPVLDAWLPFLAWRVAFPPPLLFLYRRLKVLERAGFHGMSVTVRCEKSSP